MITYEQAKLIAHQYLNYLQNEFGDVLQITEIREESFGWVYFYQSKEFLETGSLGSMLAGNAPFIVNRKMGTIHVLGTVHPVDVYIKEYALLNS